MFKRFIKFLRRAEEIDQTPFEGSYLDHLLAQADSEVLGFLEQCSDHDPLLLFATNILQRSLFNVFAPDFKSPLVDVYSPGMTPPPAPGTGFSFGLMSVEHDRHIKLAEDIIKVEESEAVSIEDDFDIVEEKLVESNPEQLIGDTNENLFDGTKEVSNVEASEHKVVDTNEIDVLVLGDVTAEMDRIEMGERPRIDAPGTLLASRRFLEILVANDSLPPLLQMDIADLFVVRDHLLSRGSSGPEVEQLSRKLLTLVEKKFNDGYFGQARLLLKLFPSDDITALNNDRNVFYEEMILKLGIRRRHKIEEDALSEREKISGKSAEKYSALLAWFNENAGIRFHIINVSNTHTKVWDQILAASTRPDLKTYSETYFPKQRWREIGNEDPVALITQTINSESIRDYVLSLLATCYFVLRAVGDTGLETFLDSFFDWTTNELGFNGTMLMPLLHRGAMKDSKVMYEILAGLYDDYLKESVELKYNAWSSTDIENTISSFFNELKSSDLSEVAPGDYNLNAFVLDRLLGFNFPRSDFAYKIHRLS